MKIQPYVTKLNGSSEFKGFMKSNKDAFVMAGFFVLDFESGKNIHQIDYYAPKKKKVTAFTLDHKIQIQEMELMHTKAPEKLDLDTKVDLEALKGILQDEMRNRNITEDIKKIIAVIQNIDGKKIWNVTCMLSGMEILRAHVEDSSESVLKMERVSMLDIVRKMSPEQMQALKNKGQVQVKGEPQAGQISNTAKPEVESVQDDAQEKMNKLNELEGKIEQEKALLQKQLKNKDAKEAVSKAVKAVKAVTAVKGKKK